MKIIKKIILIFIVIIISFILIMELTTFDSTGSLESKVTEKSVVTKETKKPKKPVETKETKKSVVTKETKKSVETKETKKPVKSKVTKKPIETDITKVLKDFEDVDNTDTVTIKKDDSKLIVKIKAPDKINNMQADYIDIACYTDWCLDNIKSDIEKLDITITLDSSEIRAILFMKRTIVPEDEDIPGISLTAYFHEDYIKQMIVK